MAKVSLIGYSIRIRKTRSKEYNNLYAFDGATDLFSIFTQYFKRYSNNSSNNQYAIEDVPHTDNKTISIQSVQINNRTIQGVIRTGDYGYSTPIVNRQSHKLSYTKDKDDTELVPLSFLLYVPKKGDVPLEKMGIAIFQKFKKSGLKGVFQSHFQDFFAQDFPDYILEMIPLTPEEVVSAFKNGVIKSAKLVSHSPPDDIADYYSTKDDDKGKLILEFEGGSFHPRFVDNLIKVFKRELPIKKIIESEWISPDEIKTTVKINGKEKTFTIKEGDTEITTGIDISDNVSVGNDGFPTQQSVMREAVKYLETLKSYLGERNDH